MCVYGYMHLCKYVYISIIYTYVYIKVVHVNVHVHSQVFARGVAKSSGDGRDVSWMLMYWRFSSVPIKLVAPVLLAYSLEFETSASVCYLLLVLAAVCALAVFWQQRRQLMSQNAGEVEPQVLPFSGTLIVGEAKGLTGSAGKAYGSF